MAYVSLTCIHKPKLKVVKDGDSIKMIKFSITNSKGLTQICFSVSFYFIFLFPFLDEDQLKTYYYNKFDNCK